MNKKILFLVVAIIAMFAIPTVMATTCLNNTVLRNTVLNTNISFKVPYCYETLINNSGGIYFAQAYNNATTNANEYLTFNLTTANGNYTYNASVKNLPYISATSDTSKTIATTYDITATTVLIVRSDCYVTPTLVNGAGASTTYTTAQYSCTSGVLTIPNVAYTTGSNTITLAESSNTIMTRNSCGSTQTIIYSAFGLIALLLIASAGFVIIKMFEGGLDGALLTATAIGGISLAIAIFIGYIVIAQVGVAIC